jgi:hypothetical protein
MVEHVYEQKAKEVQSRQHPSEVDIDSARRMAWIEWLWLAVTVMIGLTVATIVSKKKLIWAGGTLVAVGLYVLNRWSFGPSSYRELFRALFDADARAGQLFLLDKAPIAFAELTYFNVVVPAALVVVVIVGLIPRKP